MVKEGAGAQALKAKLERITLPTVFFESLPLSEVVKFLREESRRRDPDRIGINARLGRSAVAETNLFLPSEGWRPAPELSGIISSIRPELRNVRLIDTIDAITQGAERPLTCSIEDDRVVFSFALGDMEIPADVSVRAFHVATNTLADAIEKKFQVPIIRPFSEFIYHNLGLFLAKVGVDMDAPFRDFDYYPKTGTLVVRASVSELELVDAALQVLGGEAGRGSVPSPAAAPPNVRPKTE